ncbi:MAG: hypothetical protein GX365_06835, partial [Clostridiales bacterium]|nr:hypothetical protein [Clostridiales bacterium]
GPTGDTGPTGPIGSGAIIPFASGSTVELTSLALGLAGFPGLIGFGNSVTNATILGANIDLTGTVGGILNFAFSVPRDGIITSISAFFNVVVALNLILTDVTVNAQLYRAPTTSNIFSPIGGSQVILPSLTGTIAIGTTRSNILTGLSIPVSAQDRLLMVFSITASGVNLINTVIGYASAGITIE